MKKTALIVVCFSLVFKSISCFAWGSFGHELVGDIAKVYVNKSVADSVQKYLGDITWGKAAVWMDEIRANGSYDYMKPMHYINVEKDSVYVKTDAPNIINELEIVMNKLKDRSKLSKEEINESLKILFHLIGDLHMPLHVGYGADKGGNTIEVGYIDKLTNLHRAWDTDMIEHQKTFKHELVAMSKTLTSQQIRDTQKADVIAWMNESRALLPQVYDFKKDITEEYEIKNIPVIEKQILNAGIRLSGILNSLFM